MKKTSAQAQAEQEQERQLLENIRRQVIASVYAELIGQTARQNRNVEQVAPELARKAVQCADELIKSLTADHS